MEQNKRLGERIKKIRKKLGMSQLEFSKAIGATKSAVSNWENGYNAPNNERLKAIAEMGGVSVEDMLISEGELTDLTIQTVYMACEVIFIKEITEFQQREIDIYRSHTPSISVEDLMELKPDDNAFIETRKLLYELKNALEKHFYNFYKSLTPLGRKAFSTAFNFEKEVDYTSNSKRFDEEKLKRFIFSLELKDLLYLFPKGVLEKELNTDSEFIYKINYEDETITVGVK